MRSAITLADACSQIVDCEHKTAPIDPSGEHFAVGTPAMRDNRINLTESRRISKETFEAWTRRLRPQHGDLLFAREAPVGPLVRIPPEENVAPGQRTVLLRPDPGVIVSDYLYYLLTSPLEQTLIGAKASGSTVAHLNVADVRSFPLPPLPDLSQQRGIAEVLGALDDKIAANANLTVTSLELADAIFQRTAGELAFGSTTFEDVAAIQGGGTPSTKVEEYWGGDVLWATPTDVTNLGAPYLETTARRITKAGFEACSSVLHPFGSILMTSRATIGAFAIAQAPTAVNQGFIVVNAHDQSLQWWLFHEMRSRVPEFLSHANGATFLELSRGRFKKLPVRLPEDASFRSAVEPLHLRARAAAVEAEHLAETRDALLPQLMSGRIRVKDAERVVEGVV